MVEPPQKPEVQELPEAVPVPARRASPQLVWIIPLIAALIGGWLAVKAILERGPTITISFQDAEGLEAGKTTIKYKNVDIGKVTTIALSHDETRVIVTAELFQDTEKFLAEDTRFWVVRPRIAGGQVSGLGTLFSGSYIGINIGKSHESRRDFVGLETPPAVTMDRPGREFILRTPYLGSLDIGLPVYFRHLQVGEVTTYELNESGKGFTLKIFVNAPYDQYVTAETRFWNASGVDLTLNANGVRLRTQSLVSTLIGGIAFETPANSQGASPAHTPTVFTLFEDRVQAMRRAETERLEFVLYFKESLQGLSVGAPVDLRGLMIGKVRSIGLEYDDDANIFRFPVRVVVYPARLRTPYEKGAARPVDLEGERKRLLNALVQSGLRAQLKFESLVTGQLYVAFDFFPDASKAHIDWSKHPIKLPTMPGGLAELQASLTNIASNLENLPLEQIAADTQRALEPLDNTLKNVNELVQSVDAEVEPEARAVLSSLAPDAPVQLDLRETLQEIARAAQSVRVLADYLGLHPEALIRGKTQGR